MYYTRRTDCWQLVSPRAIVPPPSNAWRKIVLVLSYRSVTAEPASKEEIHSTAVAVTRNRTNTQTKTHPATTASLCAQRRAPKGTRHVLASLLRHIRRNGVHVAGLVKKLGVHTACDDGRVPHGAPDVVDHHERAEVFVADPARGKARRRERRWLVGGLDGVHRRKVNLFGTGPKMARSQTHGAHKQGGATEGGW